jgi:hypothetical protein
VSTALVAVESRSRSRSRWWSGPWLPFLCFRLMFWGSTGCGLSGESTFFHVEVCGCSAERTTTLFRYILRTSLSLTFRTPYPYHITGSLGPGSKCPPLTRVFPV